MKVYILYNGFLHFGMAASSRTRAYASALALNGNDVKIISPFGFSQRNTEKNIVKKKTFYKNDYTHEYLFFLNKHPKEYSSIYFSYFLFGAGYIIGYFKLLVKILFSRKSYDLIFIYEFSIFYSLLIRLFSISKPIVYELCEIPFPTKSYKNLILRRLREYLNFYWANGFVTISDNLYFYIYNLKRSSKVVKIPIIKESESNNATNKIELKRPSMIHIGSLLRIKDHIALIMEAYGKAMDSLSESEKIHFYLTGDLIVSDEKSKIESIIKDYNLFEYVHFIGYKTEIELSEYLIQTDIAVVYKCLNEINHFGFPTKIASYFEYGIPVIITNVGEMQKFVVNDYNGFFVDFSVDSLSNKIITYFKNINDFKHMRHNARMTFETKFNLKNEGKKLTIFFKNLSNNL